MGLMKVARVLVGVSAAVLVIGCAKAPQQDMDAAKASLDAAKKAEADVYVTAQYSGAKTKLNEALAEIQTQNSKFALTRDYKKATELLADARKSAEGAASASAGAKAQAKAEAEAMLAADQKNLADAKALLAKAPKGKEGKEALTAINDELTAVDASLAQAASDNTAGSYMAAKDKLTAAQQKIASITEELNAAIAKKAGAGAKKGGKK